MAVENVVQTMTEVSAGSEKARRGALAEDLGRPDPALGSQPAEVEFGVVGDDLRAVQNILQRAEVVADSPEVEDVDGTTLAADGEQADVAFLRVEPVAFGLTVGFQVQGQGRRVFAVGGDQVEIRSSDEGPRVVTLVTLVTTLLAENPPPALVNLYLDL